MKILSLFLLLALTGFLPPAAPFEGTIRYNVEVSGSNVGSLASMMPKVYDWSFKNEDMRMKSDAAMVGELLIRGGDKNVYLVKRGEKTVYRIDLADKRLNKTKPKITRLSEVITVAGYKCQKYTAEYKDGDEPVKQTMWVTDQITVAKPKNVSRTPNIGEFLLEEINGFPLKMSIEKPGFKIVSTAATVKKTPQNAADFQIPAGFAVKDLDLSMFE